MHSWIRRNGSFDSYDSNATFNEIILDAIQSTCGGGRKDKPNATRSTLNDSLDPYDSYNLPIRVFDDEPSAVNENHVQNTTPTGTRQLSVDRSHNNNNIIPERQSGAQTPSSVVSEYSFVRRARQIIENMPIPGKAVALRLQRLVNLPFRCVFGIDNLPPSDGNKTQHTSTDQQQIQREESNQNEIPSRSPTLPTQQQQNVLPTRHDKENQTEDILFHSPPQQEQQQPSPFLNRQQQHHYPSPKNVFNSQNNRHNSTFQNSSTLRNNKSTQTYLPTSSIYYHHPRPLAPQINVDSWALGPMNYRSIYLDNLVNQIRDNESTQAKLRYQLNCFEQERRHQLDQVELLTREQSKREEELTLLKLQYDQRLREKEELEKNWGFSVQSTQNCFDQQRHQDEFELLNRGVPTRKRKHEQEIEKHWYCGAGPSSSKNISHETKPLPTNCTTSILKKSNSKNFHNCKKVTFAI